ncbi:saccharopine dehydrogenase family protein [Natronorarus salvus]|uniref:saccharopine dehydrogenase family protein n=1 Tax=Natronorarus salvus TaxID=3117733 RepID=UPI002F26C86E
MSTLIYGATGYTGELIAREMTDRGRRPTIAGRDREGVTKIATELDCPSEVVSLDEPIRLRDALAVHDVVLHCAGPFVHTAEAMVEACLDAGTHYLDVTGEIPVFERLADRDEVARDAGVTLLPGVGFDVVPTDCLARSLADRCAEPRELRLAVDTSGRLSRGTLRTAIEGLGTGALVRRDGRLVNVPIGWGTRRVSFDGDERIVTTVPLGDLSTAYRSTGIETIETAVTIPNWARLGLSIARHAEALLSSEPVRSGARRLIEAFPEGPSEDERERESTRIHGEVVEGERSVSGLLSAPELYSTTVRTAIAAVEGTLDGVEPGFLTPATAFGPEFVDGIERIEWVREPEETI